LFWLTTVTYIGWVALALYCALYIAAFAALARFTSNVLALAAGWVFLEFVRGVGGLHGIPMASSFAFQYAFTAFTQVLDIIGGYGLGG
jgi:apolipoprotein N-acyltransferase